MQYLFKEGARVAVFAGSDGLRGALGDDRTTAVTALGAEVDDMVGDFDYVKVMLYDNNRVAAVTEAVKDINELGDVVGVEAGGWLVKDIKGLAGGAFGKLRRKLDALGLAAGECSGGLTELDIAKANVLDAFYLGIYPGDVCEEINGLVNGHFKDVGNVFALVLYL